MRFPDESRLDWLENHCRYILKKCERVAGTMPGVKQSPMRVYVGCFGISECTMLRA